LWLLDRSSACREFPLLFSGSSRSAASLNVSVAQTQLQVFWAFFRRQPPIHLFLLMHHCKGFQIIQFMVWESSGVIKGLSSSIGKQNLPRELGGRVFEVFTESSTLCAAWDTGLNASPGGRLTDAAD
jgi:hypothetical protein